MPEFTDLHKFQGQVIHPQKWPAQLDYKGKRVVIIGSGATAVTLLPAMAVTAAHVTMLQVSLFLLYNFPHKYTHKFTRSLLHTVQ